MTGKTPEVCSDKSLTLTFDIQPMDQWTKGSTQKKNTGLFGNFSQHGGGVFPIPKTQNQQKSAFKSP